MLVPAVLLGTVVGAVPGFSAANTVIILLPLTLAVDVQAALIFVMALFGLFAISEAFVMIEERMVRQVHNRRYMARVTLVPTYFLAPLIIGFTVVGAVAPRGYFFDMLLAIAFGVPGFVARKTGCRVTAILIGVILGPLFEQHLVRALRLSQGDPLVLFSSHIGNVLWALLLLSLFWPCWRERRRRGTVAVAR